MLFPTESILSCVAFSHGYQLETSSELIPLISFMSGGDSLAFAARPDELLAWSVVCGWELETQLSEFAQAIKWPVWDTDATLYQQLNHLVMQFGQELAVRPLPEGISPRRLDHLQRQQFQDSLAILFSRFSY